MFANKDSLYAGRFSYQVFWLKRKWHCNAQNHCVRGEDGNSLQATAEADTLEAAVREACMLLTAYTYSDAHKSKRGKQWQ